MSFTFDVVINPIIVSAVLIAGVIFGFIAGKMKLAKSRAQIEKLETDLMQSNMETLESQKAYVALEKRLEDHSIPVIPMKITGTKENPKEKFSK